MPLKREACEQYKIGSPKNGEIYRLKISDHILDNIYGQIGLTEVEKNIERLAIFKRLHSISQLGLVNWIFPCALHTRYTHSIGVMHIAGQMAEHINQNVAEFYGQEPFFDDSDIQIIRLAGMLHDIGHYPLSHNIEQAYKDVGSKKRSEGKEILEELKYYINCPIYLYPKYIDMDSNQIPKEQTDFYGKFRGSSGLHHESVGKSIITNNADILNTIKFGFVLIPNKDGTEWVMNPKFLDSKEQSEPISDFKVTAICKKLLLDIGNLVIGNYQEKDGSNPWNRRYSAMVQIIHSELDADNLDYLLRDATFSGTSYGIMDMGLLLNCLTVGKLVFEEEGKETVRYLVGVKKKGLGSVEQFFLNKFLAYTQMILSKYTSILEAMLLRFEMEAVDSEDDAYNDTKMKDLVEKDSTTIEYLKFSDYYIMDQIFNASRLIKSMNPFPRAAVSRLRHSCAFDLKDDNGECLCTGTDIARIKDEIKRSPVYTAFLKLCKKMEGKYGVDLQKEGGTLESELLSFRFEQHELTKQVPLDDFIGELDHGASASKSKRNDQHYYRLGVGVPVLAGGEKYVYNGSVDLEESRRMLPKLCVDCSQSSLHEIYKMRYVSLRQYKIEDYKVG